MENVIVPAPQSYDGYVELARTREYQGHHWRKHILNLGDLIHPKTGERIKLDEAFYGKLRDNYAAGVADVVAVPLANAKNQHTEAPLDNTGEVLGISRQGNKVYVDLDVRRDDVHQGLKDRTLLGASAFLNLDYTDTRTGRKVGPTLLHSCITNRPYVLGLEPYEEIVAATASDSGDDVVVLAQQEEAVPELTKDELLAKLKAEHGIDVAALEGDAGRQADLTQLTSALTAALGQGNVQLSGEGDSGEITLSDVVQAVAEVSQANVQLTSRVTKLQTEAAEREVDGYIHDGRVQPKARGAFIKLALEDRDTMNELLPAEPVVKLNHQEGGAPPQGAANHEVDVAAEITRLTSPEDRVTGNLFASNGAKR